jgi:hypothetical protein
VPFVVDVSVVWVQQVVFSSVQCTSTRTLMWIAPTLIANNVGSDLENTKAMNRSFHLFENM